MKRINLFFAFLVFFVNTAFTQKDSISHIYFGVTAIPTTMVFHTTEYKYYQGIWGPPLEYYRQDFNIALGIMTFVSFDHFMDISFGVMKDIFPYYRTVSFHNSVTEEKFNYYRIPINLKFSIFNVKAVPFFVQTGYKIFKEDDRIFEGKGYLGVGASREIKNKIFLNSYIDFSFYKKTISDKNKIFPSFLLTFSASYYFLTINNHFKK